MTVAQIHHVAYRCRDAQETVDFYSDTLGMPYVMAVAEDRVPSTKEETPYMHIFFDAGQGSCLAFFEVPGSPFDFKAQHDYDLHIALEVDPATLEAMFDKGKAAGVETRGVADHGFIRSIYFRDPNGYVIELTAPTETADAYAVEAERKAHDALACWQRDKPRDQPEAE